MPNWSHLRITPGGALDPRQIIGREDLLDELFLLLQVQSVVVEAERRTGKTSLVTLLESIDRPGVRVIKLSVEGVATPEELVRRLADAASGVLKKKWTESVAASLDRLGITGIGAVTRQAGIQPDWKPALDSVLTAIAASDQLVVVVLDELPYAVQRIGQSASPGEAREVLDLLRNARQSHRTLRFVYCGSIGFHHVIASVRAGSWSPVNDMRSLAVGPLDPDWAVTLASSLISNEAIPCDDVPRIAAYVAEKTEGVPFYIQSLLADARASRRPLTSDLVDQLFDAALDSPSDPFGVRHLEVRLNDYYLPDADLAAAILDTVAEAPSGTIQFTELVKITAAKHADAGDARIRGIVENLKRDHYLLSDRTEIRFRLNLIGVVWRRMRYLD
jgi:hypothetical protein